MRGADLNNRMTDGPIAPQIVRFAVPLFIGNLFQQLYNTADALIVGNLIGNDALAAVSATGTLVFLLISLFAGMAAGAGVVVARYYGARDADKVQRAIHTVLAFDLTVGVLLTLLGTTLTPTLLRWMGTPADVMERSVLYIRVFFSGSLGLVLYNSCRGIMQALGDSTHPLYYLIFSSLLNVALDVLFIAVFHMDVDGAALATILSQFVSAVLCLRRLMHGGEETRVSLRKIRYDRGIIGLIVRYGLPSGLQNSLNALANVIVQSNINAFGTMAVAGNGAYAKIEGFVFLPIVAFSIALTTFIGQNLGAKEYERARTGARFGVWSAIVLAELIGALVWWTAPGLVGAFTKEPEAIAYGVMKARTCAWFFCLLAASNVLAAVLRGAGKAVIPMISMISFWCVVRVAILSIAVPIWQSIAVVNWVFPITWAMSTVFLFVYFLRADWLHSFEREKTDGGNRLWRSL